MESKYYIGGCLGGISKLAKLTILYQIRNISRKSYGMESESGRLCGTRLRKSGSFDFKTPMDNDESFQYIQLIEPGGEAVFHQVFHVAPSAEPFSWGNMYPELLLAEPRDDPSTFNPVLAVMPGVRMIAGFNLSFQISPAYKYNPEATFLLVVNTDTPGSLIREIIAYINGELHLKVDVYNLSVSGTLLDKTTNQNILMDYAGKAIIILSHPMDYFTQQGRVAYEFIDPWLASKLLKAGTSMLLLGLINVNRITQHWTKMVTTPEFPIDESGADGSFHVQDVQSLLTKLHPVMNLANSQSTETKSHTVRVKKSILKSIKGSANGTGKKLAKRLAKIYPFQQYAVTADYTGASKTDPAKIIVREGLNSSITVLASSIPCLENIDRLPGPFEYLIAAVIPFDRRLQMLWTGTPNPAHAVSKTIHHETAKGIVSLKFDDVQLSDKVSFSYFPMLRPYCPSF